MPIIAADRTTTFTQPNLPHTFYRKVLVYSFIAHAFFLYLLQLASHQQVKQSLKIHQNKVSIVSSYLYPYSLLNQNNKNEPIKTSSITNDLSDSKPNHHAINKQFPTIDKKPKNATHSTNSNTLNNKSLLTKQPLEMNKAHNDILNFSSFSSTQQASSFASKQLEQLKQQMNNQAAKRWLNQQLTKKSISILDGSPAKVPHSVVPEDETEKRKQNTVNYGAGIKLYKGDDGNCSIERDLSYVGMEGLTSLESFNCGSTKMERLYSQHMKKVLRKLNKRND